jgi:undecaprenyl-diphosphatase
MSALQAILLAVVQGVTELFPISSLGHGVILRGLLGWEIDDATFLPILVVLHVGTAVALLLYFWRDWIELALALLGKGEAEERAVLRRLFVLIVIATIPAVVIGFALEHRLRELFSSPPIAAAFLVLNGVLLFVGDRLRRFQGDGRLDSLTWKDALKIGLWQTTALIPGISRSGATMVGGLLAGLSHEASAHFSFLIATPIILGAAVVEIPKLIHADVAPGTLELAVGAGLVAGVTAYASVAFLMRYFQTHEFQSLRPFAYYCWVAGIASLILLAIGTY